MNEGMPEDEPAARRDGTAPADPTRTREPEPIEPIDPGDRGRAAGGRAVDARAGDVPQRRDPARYEILGEHGRGGLGRVSRAHDRELGRDVAIKELLTRGPVHELRFLREALITARLEHPGIVPVHEAGWWPDGTPFYAMKLVAGRPLRELIAERTTIDERIGLLHHVIAVADAIAYAHDRNIIHRDLKPANVIVGEFGETIVIDWGLAKDLTASEEAADGGAAGLAGGAGSGRPDHLTSTGSVLGTPAYMAPEQERGEHVDRRADVFAIGAMLWELCALHKVPPSDLAARHRLLKRARIDRDLVTIIDKALDPDPGRRYPHAGALAADLKAFKSGARISARRYSVMAVVRHGLRRHRRRLAAGAAIAVLGGIAAWALWRGRAAAVDPCAGAGERIAGVWDGARRASVRDHLAKIDPAAGAARFAAAAAVFDGRAAAWTAMHVEACRATRVIGQQSEAAFGLRMRCLDRRLAELGRSARLLDAATDAQTLDQAMTAAIQLEPLAPCADVATLERTTRLPDDPVRRAQAVVIEGEVDAIDGERKAGRLTGLAARIGGVVERARAVGHDPTLAAALEVRGAVERGGGEQPAALATFHELAQVAARGRDDRRETLAWSALVSLLGDTAGKPDEARPLIAVARASLARAGDGPELRVEVLHSEAAFLDEHGQAAEARALLDEARGLLERQGALVAGSPLTPRLADLWFEIGNANRHDRHDAAAAAYHHAIKLWERAYGPGHADVAWGWHALSGLVSSQGKLEESITAAREAIAIREARLGDTPLLALSLNSVATGLYFAGQYEGALVAAERALRILDRSQGPDGLTAAPALITIAMAASALGREPLARRRYDEVIERFDRADAKTSNLVAALHRRALQAAKLGRCGDAVPDLERAVRVAVELAGDRSDLVGEPLVHLGACLVGLDRPLEAIPILQRALALAPLPAGEAALARFHLGRALCDAHQDAARGLAMARTARAELTTTDPDLTAAIADADRWLSARARERR